jgi:hypothetical protein
MMDFWVQAVSLLGAIILLASFVALQRGRWRSDSAAYLWCNFTGSLLLAAVAIWDRRAGFILLEGIWAAVSLWSIVRPAARRESGPVG